MNPSNTTTPSTGNQFYRKIFHLVLPIVIQNLLSAAVNSADVVMLNSVGQSSISAVSLASQYANILFRTALFSGGQSVLYSPFSCHSAVHDAPVYK